MAEKKDDDIRDSTFHKGQKRKSYSMEFKQEAITFAEENGNNSAARRFGVAVKRVREWRQNIVELCAKPKGSKKEKLQGDGRKPMDEGMEEELLEWIHAHRSRGLRVSRTLIMRKAKYIYDERCDASERDLFVASRGWLEKFICRNGLSLRRRTAAAQHDPARVIDKLISYVLHVRRLTSKHKYLASNIIAMDETAVWADMVANTTVDDIGT